jgi:polysaccharide transporter, PST family
MFSRRLLIENILSLAMLQMLNYVAPLITLPYLARVLPEQFGLLAYAQGILLYFDLFTDFGFNFSATRAISQCRDDPSAVARIFWSALAAKVLLMALSGIGVATLIVGVKPLHSIRSLLFVNYLYVVGTTFFPVWYFQGLERIKAAAFFAGAARLLTVPALIAFVKSPKDVVVAGAIQASVELTATILSAPVVYGRMGLNWYRPTWRDIAKRLQEGWPLFLSAAALQVSASSTTVILGGLGGPSEVGYYSAADKLVKAASAALTPIGQALFPRISAVRALSSGEAFLLVRRTLRAVSLLGLMLSIAVFVAAQPFCRLFLGASFANSAVVAKWLAPLPFLFGVMNVLGTQTMLVFGLDLLFSRVMLGSIFLSLPLTMLLARRSGAVGAAIATDVVSVMIVAAMIGILLWKRFPIWKQTATPEALDTMTVGGNL